MTTLRQLIDWYKAGFKYVARASEADFWHPCRTKREAERDAFAGAEKKARRLGADIMAVEETVALLVTGGLPCGPNPTVCCDPEVLDGMPVEDVILAMKLTKRAAKHRVV